MFSPLMETTIERESLPVVCGTTLDEFAAANGDTVLFVGGDWHRHVEANDVVVILPGILKAFGGHLKEAVLERGNERAVQTRFRFNRFPALIFLRDGAYLGVIQKVLDCADYVKEINEILARGISPPPQFEFSEVCAPVAHPHNNRKGLRNVQ